MAKRDTLWTCVGITKHQTQDGSKVVEKVRCGVDLARRIKSSQSKSYIKSKGERLVELRTDFAELPQPMLRIDALKFALTAPEFQSPEDQALIQEQIDIRTPKAPRVAKPKVAKTPKAPKAVKTVKVTANRSGAPSIEAIKSRAKKKVATVQDVLNAVTDAE